MKSARTAAALCLLAMSQASSPQAYGGDAAKKTISAEDAKLLVSEPIVPENRGAHVTELRNRDERDFYFFGATWANPVGSPVIGYYFVNPWTGNVWRMAGVNCATLSTPELRSHLRQIRKRLKLRNKEYRLFHARRPNC